MKASQLREMATAELEDRLKELQKQLFDLRSQSVTEKLKNNHAITNAKRDIARVLTILKEK